MNSRYLLASLFLAVLVSASGCGQDGQDRGGFSRPNLSDSATSDIANRMPFSQFELSEESRRSAQAGYAALLEECMTGRGTPVKVVGDFVRPDGQRLLWGGPLGTLATEQAAQFGYHAPPDASFALGSGFYVKSLLNVSPASGDPVVQGNFFGNTRSGDLDSTATEPSSGCLADVIETIGQAGTNFQAISADVGNLAYNDGRVQDAQRRWSQCMGDRGFVYNRVDEPTEQFILAKLTAREVEVAMADVTCTAASDWSALYYSILADYQEQAIENDANLFANALESEKRFAQLVS